jgi:hypothetical protein
MIELIGAISPVVVLIYWPAAFEQIRSTLFYAWFRNLNE